MNYWIKEIWKALFLLIAFHVTTSCSRDKYIGTELPDYPFSNFSLTDYDGNTFTLSEQKGRIILLFFGFTYCPDVCPLTLSTWKRVHDALTPEELGKVEFVYITVDPERDTAEKLKSHLRVFGEDFIGLTGNQEQLMQVYKDYGVYRERVQVSDSAAGYLINHTAYMFILNADGIWQLKHSNDAHVDDIVHDIRLLIKNYKSQL